MDDLYCGHCGRLVEDSLCPVHGHPDDDVGTVAEAEAWLMKEEERAGYNG
jgi:hypothetical protein